MDLDFADDVIGIQVLRIINADGSKLHQMGIVLDKQSQQAGHAVWYYVYKGGQLIGQMTNGGWSP
ncbi:hypothetical protein L0666_08250 [Octadecabacter sp. CECT 8868]|uniref:hypothetical protein n=1 Tax=Octadecabacter algicola TaxID=2909342 RepID=UPI001F3AA23D|nr:hypothetical protein [Octadecabacter algicola]MCF2904977.1 hypothetical protein [Octadecabacter algicola]